MFEEQQLEALLDSVARSARAQALKDAANYIKSREFPDGMIDEPGGDLIEGILNLIPEGK